MMLVQVNLVIHCQVYNNYTEPQFGDDTSYNNTLSMLPGIIDDVYLFNYRTII